jgi:SIR2-like domain/NB-ARC domain
VLDDLREQLVSGRALIVVGAGVAAATAGASTASWLGLLEDGVGRVEETAGGLPENWGELSRRQLASGETTWLISVAEEITARLGGSGGGEFRRWLKDTLGSLSVKDPSVIEAVLALRAPIATTNYDGLIEAVSGRDSVTWRDGARMQRALRGEDDAVVHVHGYWDEPRSVVLGIRSYEELLQHGPAQALQQALASVNSLVFVGFGAGLADPNFKALRSWYGERFADSEYRHFRLCREDERELVMQEHSPEERVLSVVYGTRHSDLAPFLRQLAPARDDAAAAVPPPATPIQRLPPRPLCVGRDDALAALVGALIERSCTVAVLGPPGIGKSTISVAAAHDERVVERFGAQRWFIRCDGITSASTLLTAVAEELGVPTDDGPAATLDSVVRTLDGEAALIVLDNLETPWGHDPVATEQLLMALAAAERLTLMAAIRGNARPGRVRWKHVVTVVPLEPEAARVIFLAIAGDDYVEDPHLDDLLSALDGLPLAVELLAHAAQGEPNLEGLARRWQTERVALLERLGGGDPTLSVSASVEVSWTSPLMTDEGRRLLSLLGQLPDGIAQADREALLHGEAAAAANVRKLGLGFDEGSRLRVLSPIREHLARHRPPPSDDDAGLVKHYLKLAVEEANRIGWEGGARSIERLAPETGNLNRLLTREDVWQSGEGQQAALALLRYAERTGSDTPAAITAARAHVTLPGTSAAVKARFLLALGELAIDRGAGDGTRDVNAALALYEALGDKQGQGRSHRVLGKHALEHMDYAAGREHFERAERLCRDLPDPLDHANCIKSLGDVELYSNHEELAAERYADAENRYNEIGDPLGQANCIARLGEIAMRRRDGRVAEEQFRRAYDLYVKIGDALGAGNCLLQLGTLALLHDHELARGLLEKARDIFRSMSDSYSYGFAELGLAVVTEGSDRAGHFAAAQAAWASIGREDLIELLETITPENGFAARGSTGLGGTL